MVASTKECLLVIQHDNNDDRFFLAKEMYDLKNRFVCLYCYL